MPPLFPVGLTQSRTKGDNINRLRNELQNKHIVSTFKNPDNLVSLVVTAVKLEVLEILKDKEILDHSKYFMMKVEEKMDICFYRGLPNIIVNTPTYIDGYRDIKSRITRKGGKIRVITEITKDNIEYCKRMKENIVDELFVT